MRESGGILKYVEHFADYCDAGDRAFYDAIAITLVS
jgi:hypothetical protein